MKLKILVVSCCLMFLVFASQVMGSMMGNIVRNGDFEFGDLSFWSNVSPSGNLIKNSGFEEGTIHWEFKQNAELTGGYSGYGLNLLADGLVRQYVDVTVGTYYFAFKYKFVEPVDNLMVKLKHVKGDRGVNYSPYGDKKWVVENAELVHDKEIGDGWKEIAIKFFIEKSITLRLDFYGNPGAWGGGQAVFDDVFVGSPTGDSVEGSVTAKSKYAGNYGFESPIGAECGYVQTVNTQIEANSINYLNAKYKPLSSTFNLRFLLLIGTSSYTVAASESGVTVPSGWMLMENNDVGNGWYSLKVKLTFTENKVIQSLSFTVGTQQMFLDNIEIYVSSGVPIEMGDTPTIQPSIDTSDFPVMLGLGAFGLLMFAIIPVLTIKNLKKGNYTFLAWSFVFLIIGYGAIIAWLVG